MLDDASDEALRLALTYARVKVDEQWRSRMLNGEEPTEPELTVTYIEAASPKVRYAQFNPREEGSTGADWLWWFLDKSGACFGMLIQAKKLKRIDGHWRIDFGFMSGDELQLTKLLRSSNHLESVQVFRRLSFLGERMESWKSNEASERGIRLS